MRAPASVRAHCNLQKEKQQRAALTNNHRGGKCKPLRPMEDGANLMVFMKTSVSTKELQAREMRLQTCMRRTICVQSTTMCNAGCQWKPLRYEANQSWKKNKNIYCCWMLDNWTRQQVLASRPGRTQGLWGLWFGLVWFASIKDKGTFRKSYTMTY